MQSPFYNIRRFSFFCIIRPEDTLQYRFDMEKRIVSDVKIHCRVIRKIIYTIKQELVYITEKINKILIREKGRKKREKK